MSDIPTLANSGAPAAPAQAPAPAAPAAAPASTTPPATAPRPSAPPNPRARGFSPARDRYEQIRHAQDQAPGDAPPGDRPAQSPTGDQPPPAAGEKFKVGNKYETTEDEFGRMLQRHAADDLRKATVPPSPEDYKLEISPDAKLPGDIAVRFDANDAGLIAAKNWAHGKGLDQSAFSEMLTLYASHVAQQEAALACRAREEIAKAGVNATQRVDAVGRWIRGEVGDADARPILASLVTDAHLRFFERIQHKLEGQGTASFSQSHRVAPDADTKIPGYDNMSFEQRRFAQDQMAARRGR